MLAPPGVEVPMTCPFCPNRQLDAQIVLRNDLALFVQDERYQGALKHSGLIVPVRHVETPFGLSEAEILATFRLLAAVKAWLDERFAPDGYNLGWNCGAAAGQEVFHAHLHVMPRFRHEPLAGQGIRALLKSEANAW
ncbi:MAG: HIT family protein [Vicinamibacterales bacterium]